MAATKAAPKKRSQFEEVWRRLKKNKMAMVGLAIVVFLVLLAVFADFLFDYEEIVIKQNTAIRLQGPSAEHWFGTDEFGRDILARLVHGGRISLVVGVVAVSIALVLGGTLGAISGFFGGTVDMVISRAMDILLAVPSLLLSITIVSALGPSIMNLMIAIAVSSVPGYARIVRSSVMTVRDNEFVEAAKAIGANDAQIIASHILPKKRFRLEKRIFKNARLLSSLLRYSYADDLCARFYRPSDPACRVRRSDGRPDRGAGSFAGDRCRHRARPLERAFLFDGERRAWHRPFGASLCARGHAPDCRAPHPR